MTGVGVIEGTVYSASANNARAKAAALHTSIMVYLLDAQTSEIVAQANTDEDGRFRFENVPYGTYKVLPNIDGCTVSTPVNVELTAENPIVSDVDYTVIEDEVIPDGICSTPHSDASVQGIWSLSGYQQATRGLNIIRYSDGTTRKILMK